MLCTTPMDKKGIETNAIQNQRWLLNAIIGPEIYPKYISNSNQSCAYKHTAFEIWLLTSDVLIIHDW